MEMVRLRGGTYYTWIHGHLVVLFHIKGNRCSLYIDGSFKGRAPFHYTKAKIHRMKQNKKHDMLYYKGNNIWEEGRKGVLVHVKA
ncbi:hypothetical protein SAMN04488054_11284 [Salibacterium qingdaonense]|uniref:Uncharacterized protein n=1 Tax=Salibacterium qingdaonense TaxID=266892 RepID=A0A1I4MMJ1_9BACI|nr:hypothetical protein SAMN04488054_11284 [Salibacterium qingdaonense]